MGQPLVDKAIAAKREDDEASMARVRYERALELATQPACMTIEWTTKDVLARAAAFEKFLRDGGVAYIDEQVAHSDRVPTQHQHSVPYGWHRNGDGYDTDFRMFRAKPKVPDREIVDAAVKKAARLDVRERALRLAQEGWLQVPDERDTVLKRAERIERWLLRPETSDTGETT